jgi:serine/threonine protein kinase
LAKPRVWGRWIATGDSFDRGGQGQVYFVHDSTGAFEGEFVLKQLINPKRIARFETEITAITKLSGHPHVIDLVDHGAFRDADKPTYVMRKADMALDRYLNPWPQTKRPDVQTRMVKFQWNRSCCRALKRFMATP